jgi:hypothetical protein
LPGLGEVLRWLTPATVALMLVFMVANQRTAPFGGLGEGAPAPLLIAGLSNQFYAAYVPAGWHSYLNAWPAPRLGWTNEEAFGSSNRSFPRTGTNHLRW